MSNIYILIFFCLNLQTITAIAEDKWGEVITPQIKKEKISDFIERKYKYEYRVNTLAAQTQCKYLKQNSFSKQISESVKYKHTWRVGSENNRVPAYYSKISQEMDKGIATECSRKETYPGTLQQAFWGPCLTECFVETAQFQKKNTPDSKERTECLDYCTQYFETAGMIAGAAIETINSSANKKGKHESADKDCGGGVVSTQQFKPNDQDKVDAIPASGTNAVQK